MAEDAIGEEVDGVGVFVEDLGEVQDPQARLRGEIQDLLAGERPLDVLPLLLVLAAAAAWPERGRGAVRVLDCALILAGAVNNARQLVRSAEAANTLASQRVGR